MHAICCPASSPLLFGRAVRWAGSVVPAAPLARITKVTRPETRGGCAAGAARRSRRLQRRVACWVALRRLIRLQPGSSPVITGRPRTRLVSRLQPRKHVRQAPAQARSLPRGQGVRGRLPGRLAAAGPALTGPAGGLRFGRPRAVLPGARRRQARGGLAEEPAAAGRCLGGRVGGRRGRRAAVRRRDAKAAGRGAEVALIGVARSAGATGHRRPEAAQAAPRALGVGRGVRQLGRVAGRPGGRRTAAAILVGGLVGGFADRRWSLACSRVSGWALRGAASPVPGGVLSGVRTGLLVHSWPAGRRAPRCCAAAAALVRSGAAGSLCCS